MLSLAASTTGAFRAAMAAGTVTLTLAGASLGTSAPAEAFVRPHDGFHGGHRVVGFRHDVHDRFRAGFGHRFGVYRFGYRLPAYRVGFHPYGYGARRFAYRIGVPYGGYGFRRCGVGFRFVPGIGCRRLVVYGASPVRIVRPLRYAVVRMVHPYGWGAHRYGWGVHHYGWAGHRFAFDHGRPFGGYGFRHAGFGDHHAGFRHLAFEGGHHGGHAFRRH